MATELLHHLMSHGVGNGPHVVKLFKVQDPKALARFEKEIKACPLDPGTLQS